MKRSMFLAAAAALFLTIGSPASAQQAETWTANSSFVSGMQRCANFPTVVYTYTFDGQVLTVRNMNGKLGTIKVAPDGKLDEVLSSPTGAKLRFSGNAKTKQLKFSNAEQCVWNTTPSSTQAARQ